VERRSFIAGTSALATAAACGGEDMTTGIAARPPWHLWGSSQVLEATISPAGSSSAIPAQQILKVGYKRPIMWGFFFGARVIDGPAASLTYTITVRVQMIIGVGRSAFLTEGLDQSDFVTFNWLLNSGFGIQSLNSKWTTSTVSPPLDDTLPATTVRPLDFFPAQDIQCSASIQIGAPAAPPGSQTYKVELTGYVAPLAHVRPDWFRDVPEPMQFPGDEIGGL